MALVKLYRVTGEEKYLDTAEYFIRERGRNRIIFWQRWPEERSRNFSRNSRIMT